MIYLVRSPNFVKLYDLHKCFNTRRRFYSIQNLSKSDRTKGDWIGPPHPVSNILTMELHVSEKESTAESEFRERRIETHTWNHEFWEKHNTNFFKAKKEYEKKTLEEKYLNEPTRISLPVDDMAVFYKKFLDENYRMHMVYNKEWYKKNFLLLWYACKALIYSSLKRKT